MYIHNGLIKVNHNVMVKREKVPYKQFDPNNKDYREDSILQCDYCAKKFKNVWYYTFTVSAVHFFCCSKVCTKLYMFALGVI